MSNWQDRARCAGDERDPEDFFRINEDGTIDTALLTELAEFCWGCAVKAECAAFSVRPGGIEQHGVWAGTTWRERQVAARKPDPVEQLMQVLKQRAHKRKDHRKKAMRGGTMRAEYRHGLTAYIQYGCRCQVCKDASAAYRASKKQTAKAVS